MDCQQAVIGQYEDDHLEHVAGLIWPDGQLLRRVSVRIEVDHHKRVIRGMTDVVVPDAMPSSRRVDLYTLLV